MFFLRRTLSQNENVEFLTFFFCCELTAFKLIYMCMQTWSKVYNPIPILHNAASKASDILVRCYG